MFFTLLALVQSDSSSDTSPLTRSPLVQENARLVTALTAIVHSVMSVVLVAAPERASCVIAIFAKGIELEVDLCELCFVVVVISGYALQSIENRLPRTHAVPHILDNRVPSRNPNV